MPAVSLLRVSGFADHSCGRKKPRSASRSAASNSGRDSTVNSVPRRASAPSACTVRLRSRTWDSISRVFSSAQAHTGWTRQSMANSVYVRAPTRGRSAMGCRPRLAMYGVQNVPARTTTYIQATRPSVLAASASVRHWWRFSTGEIFGYSGDVTEKRATAMCSPSRRGWVARAWFQAASATGSWNACGASVSCNQTEKPTALFSRAVRQTLNASGPRSSHAPPGRPIPRPRPRPPAIGSCRGRPPRTRSTGPRPLPASC
ncbi:hypothetical protein ACFQ3Z_33905 [Streptomyces nogalater]